MPQPSTFPRNADEVQCRLDWAVFAKHFEERQGFAPTYSDSRAKDLVHYFTAGAHEEFMGRLTTE